MSNKRMHLLITADEIYNNLEPFYKGQCSCVEIIQATINASGDVVLECLALEDDVIDTPYIQTLSLDKCITA